MGKRGEILQAQVFDVLGKADGPLSAYDVLGELRSLHPKIAPTTVYRALSALTEKGRVHRLESLNAYMPCQCEEHAQEAVLAICDDCGSVEESVSPDVLEGIAHLTRKSGFSASRHVVEIHGTCADCGSERDAK